MVAMWTTLLGSFVEQPSSSSTTPQLKSSSSKQDINSQSQLQQKDSTDAGKPTLISNKKAQSARDLLALVVKPSILHSEFWAACGRHHPDSILCRFLRARRWDAEKAHTMFLSMLKWRSSFESNKVVDLGESAMPRWMLDTGLVYVHGRDMQGRPIIFMSPRHHDKTADRDQVRMFCVWFMETLKDYFVTPEAEKVTICIDLQGTTLANFDIEITKFLIQCLSDYYPESLGSCLILNAPYFFW
jgi:hypothetical protein